MAYSAVSELRTELIRKALKGSVLIAPSTASAINPSTLFDSSSGDLAAAGIPAGYDDIGVVTDAGVTMKESVTATDIKGWGFNAPVRTDITADTDTLTVEPIETKAGTIGVFTGTDPTTYTYGTNGVLAVTAPAVRAQLRYRVLVLGVDVVTAGEIVTARFYPSMQLTSPGDQTFANGSSATSWPLTLTAYVDSVLGYAKAYYFGGAGWKAAVGDASDPRIVTCTVATTTALVATTGTFTASDVGRFVNGAGITPGTTIVTFTDATHVVMSAVGTAGATLVPVTID